MDKSAEEITFDETGVCNFCRQAERSLSEVRLEKHKLKEFIKRIKKDGGEYDCLIGLSGGADSSTALHYAIKYGLKPLCYTVDNGWNTALSDENILKMVEKLKVPFIRKTINLKEFRKLQSAFMLAGQRNLEIPTDHIIMATALQLADKYKIKWIISGGNVVSESIMPESWGYQARDLVHIKDVYRKTIGGEIKDLPLCGTWKWNYYKWIKGIKTFYLLDYLPDDYEYFGSREMLNKEYNWIDYGGKHEESTYTHWFQGYYLFEKFGIDKRKAHYSSLIASGQYDRKEALKSLTKSPVFPEIGLEKKSMKYERKPYTDFKTDKWFDRIRKFIKICKYLGIIRQA